MIPTISKNLLIAGMISVAAIIFAALWLYQVHAQSVSFTAVPAQKNSPGTVYLSGEAPKTASAAVASHRPMQEIHIANSGFTLLEGARVIAVEGSQIRVRIVWGANDFTWSITTNSGTKFYAANGEKETLADVLAGDIISASGQLVGDGGEPVIQANFVRESI